MNSLASTLSNIKAPYHLERLTMAMFNRNLLLTVLLVFFNLPASATYLHDVDEVYFENPLKGISKMAINIKKPTGDPTYSLESRGGITKESLESEIATILNNAGFEVISLEAARHEPEVAYLDLDYHINLIYQLIYTFEMNVAIRQKLKLKAGDDTYLTVKTWSDSKVGGMSQTDLGKIRTYAHEMVDNFIQARNSYN